MSRDSRTAIFLQDACYLHRYIRSSDLSTIVERPERLRAVKLGISAAIARLEEASHLSTNIQQSDSLAAAGDDLAAALEKLDLLTERKVDVVDVIRSNAVVDLLNHEAVKFVHGDIEGDVYLEKLVTLAKDSGDKIANGESEIPSGLSQGDLYLCPESLSAIQGALGTVCEAVDNVLDSQAAMNAFVAIRPPGHHCGEDTPSGFCFVNNVAVAAAHAHLRHKVQKVVIFDIDLHHGNGTQSIAWQINEETYRKTLEDEACEASQNDPGLMVYYGSIHDVLSYPCEDGKVELVQAASTSIHGAHGQHIENIHLEPYTSEDDFWTRLYPKYTKLLSKAEAFVQGTNANEVLVFISCGFDACEHEYSSMSRHGRKVPTSFYHRFARDARVFANQHANGKIISVLEGGYSDRALISGAMAHVAGLAGAKGLVDESWWSVENLTSLEKLTKKRRGGGPKTSVNAPPSPWLDRTTAIYATIEDIKLLQQTSKPVIPPSSMTLRERKPAGANGNGSGSRSAVVSPKASPKPARKTKVVKGTQNQSQSQSQQQQQSVLVETSIDDVLENMASLKLGSVASQVVMKEEPNEGHGDGDVSGGSPPSISVARKLPKVILRVKQPEDVSGETGGT